MANKWRDKDEAALVLERLRPKLSKLEDGGWGLKGLGIERDLLALEAVIRFDEGVPTSKRGSLASSAMLRAAAAGRFHQGGIAEEIRKAEKKLVRRRRRKFVLLSSLSVQLPRSLRGRRFGEGEIRFHRTKPCKFDTSHVERQRRYLFSTPLPENYCFVAVYVSAREESEASEAALNTLDLLRGLWNLFYNRAKGVRWSGGRKEPLNDVLLGPIHTLHLPSGDKAGDLYWWEPGYYKPKRLLDLSQEFSKLSVGEKRLRARMNRCNFQYFLENAVVRYVRALDEPNMSTALLKLWGALEYITQTGYEGHKTANRSVFIFKQRQYHKIVLDRLRQERNHIAHEGSEPELAEKYLYLLNFYASEALHFLLNEGWRFRSVEEYCTVLDLPVERDGLAQAIAARERELKLLSLARSWFSG